MHSAQFSSRLGFLASTALALIVTASPIASAAPPNPNSMQAPQSAARDYSTPGSMPKPSSAIRPTEDSIRFRGTLPASGGLAPARHDTSTPLSPSSNELRNEPQARPAPPAAASRPVTVPETARAQAEPEPAIKAVPEPVARPAAVPVKPAAAEAAVAPAPNAASEAQVAAKLREIISGKQFDRVVTRKPERDAIVALYQKARAFQPLWVAQGAPSARASDVMDHLRTIDADGLDPKDYPMPRLNVGSAEEQAQAELKFTEMLLTYARHAMTGRVHFSRVTPNVEYKLAFDADDVLRKIAASNDLPKTLDTLNPQQPAYQALKAKLAELRDNPAADDANRIGHGPVLRYTRDSQGRETVMADARVPRLREKLNMAAEPNSNYNRALAMAVGKFQKAKGLQVTGQLNGPTVDALNPPGRAAQLDAVMATMERWRWMPRDLGKTHVVLNIPDYHLRVYNGGEKVWQTRVVVGKPTQATPLLTETMKFITVNPTWNVPQSIIYNELLPIYETSDPQIFERQGLKVERASDGGIRVFQPPGERNALGQIRFNFPNKFLVYQHDTPEKHYFAQDKRAYSHGCMRVQDPYKYAEVLLSYAAPRASHTADSIKRMLGGEEKQIDFATHIPVHITYQTAFVDEAGKLQMREDVYGLDAKLISILKGSERQVADVAIERPADPNFKPTPEQGQRLHNVARGGGSSPFALFEQLFR